MPTFDSATWGAFALVLTLVGLALSVLAWRKRGAAAGVRGVAWSLLPLAAALTGTLKLLWRIADAVISWALHLVFSPVVWLGLAVAALSAALFVASAALRRRGVGGPKPSAGVPSRRGGSTLSPARAATPTRTTGSAPAVPSDDGDDADIEALLKKHGIT